MPISAAARLDRLPIGPFHHRMLFLIGAGMFFDSFDLYLAGGVLGALLNDGWSSLAQNANFITGTFLGMVIGSAGAGLLGDRFGRKFTYQFNLAIFGLASLAAAVAPNMTWLLVMRFISGIGLGAEIVIGYGTMIELLPPKMRGRWAAWLSLLSNFGLFAATLAGWLVIPMLGWRWMFVLAGAGALCVLLLRRAIPESPRWLESKGRHAEADAVLRRIEAGYPSLPPPENLPDRPAPGFGGPAMLRHLAFGTFLSVMLGIGIYGFVVWVPTMLVRQGVSLSNSLGQSMLMSLGGPAGALLAGWLADRLGRRRAIIGASLLGCAVGTWYAQADTAVMAVALGFGMFTLIYFLVAIVVAGYMPELFPTALRMRGYGLCGTVSRIIVSVVPQAAVAVLQAGGVVAVLGCVTGALALLAAVVWAVGVETSQRSLETIGP